MEDDAISSFIWLSGTNPFPVNEVNYMFVKHVDDMYQSHEFIGYQDDKFVFSNHWNGDVAFCDGEVSMLENLEDRTLQHYYVESFDDFNFSSHVF